MLQLKTILFTVLLVAAGALAQGEDCPNRATECPDNCGGAQCPRFLNAECQVNPCHGLCTPNFMWRGKNVTHRCDVERCGEKNCPGKRECVEEIVPPSCPGNGTQCRQFIRSRCILPPSPTDCSQITCGPGMYCREIRGGKGVKCARARNCNQLTCSEGLSCSETEEGPMCMATSSPMPTSTPTVSISTPFPNFCDFCASLGQDCSVVNGSYQCTEPTKCNSVRIDYCLNLGQLCKEINGTTTCDFANSCSEINCPRGTVCEDSFGFALCNRVTVAKTCDQLNCEFLPGMVCEQRNGSAMCVTGCSAQFIEICASAQARCEVVNGLPDCVIDTQQSCENLNCTEGGTCVHVSLPSRNFSLALCVSSQFIGFFPTIESFMCPGSPTPCQETDICTDVYQNGLFISPSCNNFTTDCIDDTACALNEVCTDVPNDLGVTLTFTEICLPKMLVFEFGDSCASDSKQCPDGLVCQDIALEGVNIGTSCGTLVPNPIATSCAQLEPCPASLECANYYVAGSDAVAQCTDKESADNLFQVYMSLANLG